MKLRKIGRVSHVSKSGFIVAIADPKNLPRVGSEVYTRKMERIGFVYDIIGPTKSPFVLIKPKRDILKRKVLDELFVVVGEAHAGGREGKGSRKGERKRGRKERDRKRRNH
jgi:rRNA processing protein Gar1